MANVPQINFVKWTAIIALCVGSFIIGRLSKRQVVEYRTSKEIIVKKEASEITPILERLSKPIVLYNKDTVYIHSIDSILINGPTTDELVALLNTAKDWNTQRTYNEELINSDTLGVASLNAVIQYNKLQSYEYHFTPVTRVISKGRLEGYTLLNVTNLNSSLALGVKYRRFGVHAIGGVNHDITPFYGVGVMIGF